jgi:hypothetical protein
LARSTVDASKECKVFGGQGGFTVASENPVNVQGNCNADASGFDSSGHVPAAILADAVTLLSGNWNDASSFRHPTYVDGATLRQATTTWYRFAVAAGKNRPWDQPGWGGVEEGLDGGTHNFLRFLERWQGQEAHYRGSLINLFYSEYAVGLYECCSVVYTPPTRRYSFDTDFLHPDDLSPATPNFRDVVNVGFRQLFNAEQ